MYILHRAIVCSISTRPLVSLEFTQMLFAEKGRPFRLRVDHSHFVNCGASPRLALYGKRQGVNKPTE